MKTYSELAGLVADTYKTRPSVLVADDVRATILNFDDEIVVAIPGTTDLAGWLRDLDAEVEWFTGVGPCHKGFGSGGVELHRNIAFGIPPGKLITYTGHSLGGAMAQVCAARHAMWHHPPCRCIVFGSPRVATFFNVVFGRYVREASDLKLFKNFADPVPEVPTAPLFLHVEAPVVLGHEPSFGRGLFGNHHIGLYQDRLR